MGIIRIQDRVRRGIIRDAIVHDDFTFIGCRKGTAAAVSLRIPMPPGDPIAAAARAAFIERTTGADTAAAGVGTRTVRAALERPIVIDPRIDFGRLFAYAGQFAVRNSAIDFIDSRALGGAAEIETGNDFFIDTLSAAAISAFGEGLYPRRIIRSGNV